MMQRQPTSGEVFVFLNRNRTHIKLLRWEHGGGLQRAREWSFCIRPMKYRRFAFLLFS
ncbi:transposase [Sphingobacterium sp. SGL-16]|nr:transposase [Sphingobacterium sp. SGL-16]